jgi:hypothetical protein
VAGAVLWSIPMLAAGLLALLRYGFGSLFVVGESVASVLLSSTGADIAGTLQRLHTTPLRSAAGAALGVVSSAGAASLSFREPLLAGGLALAAAAWAWWYGIPVAAAALLPAAVFALLAAVTSRSRG